MFEVTYHRDTFNSTLLDCNNNFIFQMIKIVQDIIRPYTP